MPPSRTQSIAIQHSRQARDLTQALSMTADLTASPLEGLQQSHQLQGQPRTHDISSSDSSIKSGHESPAPAFNPGRRFYLAFLALAVLTLMVALDGTSLSVAIPTVAQALKGSALEAFWSGTSFLLASTVFQPSFAQLSHVFGRVQMIMVAITFFFVGVMMAALSHNFSLLLAGRTLQGLGGGGLIALTEIIVTDLTPLRYRGQWAGIIGGMWAIGRLGTFECRK